MALPTRPSAPLSPLKRPEQFSLEAVIEAVKRDYRKKIEDARRRLGPQIEAARSGGDFVEADRLIKELNEAKDKHTDARAELAARHLKGERQVPPLKGNTRGKAKAKQAKKLEPQDRDLEWMRLGTKVKIMTAQHAQIIEQGLARQEGRPAAKVPACRKRLYDLRQAGYVDTFPLPELSVWMLETKARTLMGLTTTNHGFDITKAEHELGVAFLVAHAMREGKPVFSDYELNRAQRTLSTAHKDALKGSRLVPPYIPATDFHQDDTYGLADEHLAEAHIDCYIQPAHPQVVAGLNDHKFHDNRTHVPDVVIVGGPGKVIALELELAPKNKKELVFIIGCHIRALEEGRFYEVRYYCSDAIKNYITKTVNEWSRHISTLTGWEDKITFMAYDPEVFHSKVRKSRRA